MERLQVHFLPLFPFLSYPAHLGDPFSSIVVGGYTDRADIVFIQSRQSVAAAAIGGTIHVLKADGEIVGVAIWFKPGQSLNSTCVLSSFPVMFLQVRLS